MKAAEWIMAARPEAPERLVARVCEVLDAHPQWEKAPLAEALVEAADALLHTVLTESEGAPRDRALDLLAADACVTWAFEAAADEPASLGAHAAATMERLAKAVVA